MARTRQSFATQDVDDQHKGLGTVCLGDKQAKRTQCSRSIAIHTAHMRCLPTGSAPTAVLVLVLVLGLERLREPRQAVMPETGGRPT